MEFKPFFGKSLIMIITLLIVTSYNIYSSKAGYFLQNFTDKIKSEKVFKMVNYNSGYNRLSMDSKEIKNIILYDGEDKSSLEILKNFENVLNFTKKKFLSTDISSSIEFNYKDLNQTIILITSNTEKIPDIHKLMEFINNGGKVIFAQNLNTIDESFSLNTRDIGVVFSEKYKIIKKFIFLSDFLLDSKGKSFNNILIKDKIKDVSLDSNSTIHIISESETPVVWETVYGKGLMVFANISILESKLNRGLLSGLLGLVEKNYIYPILNAKVIFIDDFPSPFPNGFNEKIKKRYNRNIKEFFRDIWWPDMVKSSKLYNVKYTGYFIETYNDRVEPPFRIGDSYTKEILSQYGIELIKNGGELGLHGYNHQPFDLSGIKSKELGYNSWGNEDNILKALKEGLGVIENYFPNYKVKAYVPPSNIITEKGIHALKKGMKDLLVISAVFNSGKGDPEYIQEFNIMDDGIVEFPRLTSGYLVDDEMEWINLNSIVSTGIISHFVHSDDMLERERSDGKPWEEMKLDYFNFIKSINDNFFWLEPLTTSEAAIALKNYKKFEFYSEFNNKKLSCYTNGIKGKQTFILKSENSIKSYKNCEIEKVSKSSYIISSNNDKFSINFN
ncbi:MAG: DUF2194 domain-containing protein [Clostridiales bacterium]